ncbi:MAG: thiamine diphosphokinase [Ectothiorhodospiraceae bacterium]|nr:thiamine diphosphokinase [Ectothiorhodospiraceae bacterium]
MQLYDLLICNGSLPAEPRAAALADSARSIICADGGANKARAYGITPQTVIGDFDSISPQTLSEFEKAYVEFIHAPQQDRTDFEKALLLLEERGARKVIILGVTGGQLDHTLGNLSIIQRYVKKLDMTLYDPDFRIDIITGTKTFTSRKGQRISIVPLRLSSGIWYEGLEYPLPTTILKNGLNEGTCNTAVEDEFTVHLAKGTLLIMRQLDDSPSLW